MKLLKLNRLFPIVLAPILVLAGFTYGILCSEWRLPPYHQIRSVYLQYITRNLEKGRWRTARHQPGASRLSVQDRRAIERLAAIGYLPGYELAPDLEDVTTYLPDLAYSGLNLYTSGHKQEAILMSMRGKVLHKWSYDLKDAFPEQADLQAARSLLWVNVHLFPNGDLLAIVPNRGLIKVDRHSNLIWAKQINCHHQMQIEEDGTIYILTTQARIVPEINENRPVLEDFITLLDSQGNLIREISLLEAFETSSYASVLQRVPDHEDIFHTNTLERLDGSLENLSPIFKNGNILVSMRSLDLIAIIDIDQEKVVWALTGQWIGQHRPILLDNGNMLLFDNLGHHGMSKVIEFDPLTQEIIWAYEGTEENEFLSETCGVSRRLPNGNTLITESDSGRAFEVNPNKQIVWEFYNPARTGENDELIATLFEVLRLPPDLPAWLE